MPPPFSSSILYENYFYEFLHSLLWPPLSLHLYYRDFYFEVVRKTFLSFRVHWAQIIWINFPYLKQRVQFLKSFWHLLLQLKDKNWIKIDRAFWFLIKFIFKIFKRGNFNLWEIFKSLILCVRFGNISSRFWLIL